MTSGLTSNSFLASPQSPRSSVLPQLLAAALLTIGATAPALALAGELVPLADKAVVLAFGDSLTSGIGGSGENYPQRLVSLIGHDVINAGVPGETTAQGRERLAAVLHDSRPGLLILCLGVNDFLRGVPVAQIGANLGAMLDLAADASVPVLLLAVPAPGAMQIDPLFAGLARPGQVRVDLHAMADTLMQPALKAGLVHPNAEGYRRIAAAVAQSLRDSGALGSR